MQPQSGGPDRRASLSLALGAAYIIDRELDVAGTARVFVAHEEVQDQDVVIVELSEEVTRGISAERFAAEMRLAAKLDEQHTVPVLMVGQTASGLHFYTMPYVRGLTLRQRIEQGPVGFDESITVLRDVARSMAYAHALGFVHRHLAPENVLLTRNAAIVTDFGLARALERSGAIAPQALLTHSSYTALPYIPPEQAAGDRATDQRADIYAWGVMAYELLLDADPFFDVTSPALAATMPISDIPPLQLFKRHGVPEQLALLVMRCCEYDPAARPANATELLSVLDRIPDRASTLALERKNAVGWVGASIIAALVLFVASGVAVWRLQKRENREAPLIAVLPFEVTDASPDSLFVQRFANSVTAKLSKLSGLHVIDGESVRSIMDSSGSARAIGKALGADYVLRTSARWVRVADGTSQLLISPVVLRILDGKTKWASGPEVVSPADPFAAQTRLATMVANELDVFLGEKERAVLAGHGTRDTAAYAAFARGDRLYRENATHATSVYERALREFERAYHTDPRYADAFGAAALALLRMGEAGGPSAPYDTAIALARHALTLAPEQGHALVAVAVARLAQDRPDDARSWDDRAIAANPSDIEALELRAELLPLVGDSAGTWRDIAHLVALAPRSADALVVSAASARTLRRFTDARDFLQRARLLDPTRIDLILHLARLAFADGDFGAMARAVREFRQRGGHISSEDLALLRVGDDAMRRELAESPPAAFGVRTREDSVDYYSEKAQLFLARHDRSAARALLDSSETVLGLLLADSTLTTAERARYADFMAWTDAARGDRARALAVATGVEHDTITLQWPNGQLAAAIACNSAEIFAFVDDVEEMIPQLRRCLTLPGGYAPNAISAVPALWRHAADPRLRALLYEFKLDIRPKEP